MVASSLSTIVIHFPFRLMSGLAGSFFKELSDTMQITMVCSFLVTWLLLPVLHLLIGSLPGIWVGTHLVHRINERFIRSILSVLLAWAGVKLIAI